MSVAPSQRWIEQQRSKPSFVVAGRDAHDIAFESTLLNMPQSLQSVALPPQAAYSASPSAMLAVPAASPRRASTPPASVARSSTPARGGVRSIAHGGGSPSASQAPSVPIYEKLHQRGKLYEQHLEGLREKAIHQETRRCRSVPRISAMGHNIQRESAIEVRLQNVHEEKRQVAVFNNLILEKREKGILDKWFHPTISSKGKRASGKARKEKQKRLHETWEFKRQQRVDDLRREKVVKEMEGMRGMPDIDPRSELLAARRREKEGMAGYTHLEAMLERDRLAKLARWEENQRQLMQRANASPRVTEFAASMHRTGDVADRLLADAAAREERRLQREREHLEDEQRAKVGSQSQRAFHPDELFARHLQYNQKRDDKIRLAHEAERRMHMPQINPTSDQLASRMPLSTMERLTTPPRARTPSKQEPPRSTTPRNRAQQAAEAGDDHLYERLQLADARRRLHIDAARTEQEAREMEQCTFAPATTVSYYPPSNTSDTGPGGPGSVYERMRQWQQRRQDRLDEQRKREDQDALEGATFQPRINTPLHTSARTGDISGFDDFVQRQQSAARHRQPDGGRTPSQGDSTVGRQPTTPQAPVLGRERDASRTPVVLSLQRPVSAPSATDYGTPSQLRYSLSGQQVAAGATPLAQQFIRGSTLPGGNDDATGIPAALDTVSLDTDEQDPRY